MRFSERNIENLDTTIGHKRSILPFILGLTPILSIVLDEKFVPFYILLLTICYFFENNKKRNYQRNKEFLVPFILMISVFIIYTILSSNIFLSLKVLERQISFILLPIIIITSNWTRQRMVFFFRVFTYALSLFCLFSFVILFWFYINDQDWINTMNRVQNNETYLLFKYPHLLNTHPTYWSYLLIFGNIIIFYNFFFHLLKNNYLGIVKLMIFNITILLLASRTCILINGLVFVLALFMLAKYKKYFLRKELFLVIVGIIVVVILAAPKFNFLMVKSEDIFKDDRFYLWPIALDQIKRNYYVLGEGLGLGNIMLKEFIIENGDLRKNYTSYDLHNQYLKHYLDMGLLGLFALLYFIFSPIILNKKLLTPPNCFLIFSLIVLIGLACMTEAPLYRLKGIVFFSIVYSVFLLSIGLFVSRHEMVQKKAKKLKLE